VIKNHPQCPQQKYKPRTLLLRPNPVHPDVPIDLAVVMAVIIAVMSYQNPCNPAASMLSYSQWPYANSPECL
jgi:hypothetical protein